MTTLTMNIDNETMNFISKKYVDINSYLLRLIKEDILSNQIQESKKSWIYRLSNLDDLDK